MRLYSLIIVLAAALSVTAAPTALTETLNFIEARQPENNIVPHNSIAYIPETVRDDQVGETFKKFEPHLHVSHGCQSYPAVSSDGKLSGGLQNTGGASSGCNDGRNGQTYVRGGWHGGKLHGRFGIVYAWYFPKDQATSTKLNGGHRHDWECVVVWVDNPENKNPRVIGTAASGHGGFQKNIGMTPFNTNDHPEVEYFTRRLLDHRLHFNHVTGSDLAMVDWEVMPPVARSALNGHSWGKAVCPVCDKDFDKILGNAWIY